MIRGRGPNRIRFCNRCEVGSTTDTCWACGERFNASRIVPGGSDDDELDGEVAS